MAILPTSFSKSGSSFGAWFSVTNHIDDPNTVVIADAEITEAPASNLTQRNADTIYRATGILSGDSEIILDFDFGSSKSIDVLSFMTTRSSDPAIGDQGSTLSGSDTVRHQLGTTSGGNDVYDSGLLGHGMISGHGIHTHILPSTQSARYWRLRINALSHIESAPGGEVDFTRAWAGEVFNFDINSDYGADIQWQSNSVVIKTERGAEEFIDIGDSFRAVNMTFSGINQSEFNYLLDFDRITSGQQQILFGSQKTELGRFSLLGRNSPTGGVTYLSPGRFRKRLRIIESL